MFWKFETVDIKLWSENRKKLKPVGNKENVAYCARKVNFCIDLGIIYGFKRYAVVNCEFV